MATHVQLQQEALFNESQSRIVISVAPENLEKTMSILRKRGVPFERLGQVGGDELRIRANNENFRWPISDLYDDWWNSIRRAVESDSAPNASRVCEARSKCDLRGFDSRELRSLFGSGPFRAVRKGHGCAFEARATQERSRDRLRDRNSDPPTTRQPRPGGATCRDGSEPRNACICTEQI